jgi:3-phenylpropionate/cinnamic acid dioxygenase small subunit
MTADGPIESIHRLVYRYAELLDQGDFGGVGGLFAGATYRAEVAAGKIHVHHGAAEVEALLNRLVILYEDGTPRTKHVMTNVLVELGGGSASSRTYFTVFQAVPPDVPLQAVIVGRYHDSFEVGTDGQWRFVDRLIYSDLQGDLSRHVRGFDRL